MLVLSAAVLVRVIGVFEIVSITTHAHEQEHDFNKLK
jgi:hypothetical protein